MRIYWITKLTDSDPYRTTQIELSEALKKRGHDVVLALAKDFSEKKENRKNIEYLPTINFPILSGFVYGLIIFFCLPLIVRNKKIDIILIDGDAILSPFFLTMKLHKMCLIWDTRSLPIDKEKSIFFNISLNFSKYLVHGFTTITPELSEIIKKQYHLKNKKIGIWSSGISKEKYLDSNPVYDNSIKTEHKEKIVLMYHGTYSPTRGIENLIRSIAEIETSIKKNIKLILVGIPENKKQDLLFLCEKLEITDYIEIILPVENSKIPQLILSADVGIIPLPPKNEWWRVSVPLKTLEYLALSKPIIATDIPFHKKIFDMGKCGILLNNNEPKNIAKAIMYLYNNQEELIEMGKKGREIAEKYYTWDHKALELEKILKSISVS